MESKPLMWTMKATFKDWTNYMHRVASEVGIPDPYRMIIMYLSRHPGASQKDVAAHCQKTYASISQTVKSMLRTGYVTKKISTEDQRYAQLYLTDKGQDSVERLQKKLREADRLITSAITPEKEQEIIEMLNLLSETIREEL